MNKPNCFNTNLCERCIRKCDYYRNAIKDIKLLNLSDSGVYTFDIEYYDGRIEEIDELNDLRIEFYQNRIDLSVDSEVEGNANFNDLRFEAAKIGQDLNADFLERIDKNFDGYNIETVEEIEFKEEIECFERIL